MGRPRLTEYLLKLATDAEALEQHRKGTPERDASMTAAGLSSEQQQAVSSNDSRQIVEAVVAELARESSTDTPFYGTGLAVVVPLGEYFVYVQSQTD